jgi:hypothetical protein
MALSVEMDYIQQIFKVWPCSKVHVSINSHDRIRDTLLLVISAHKWRLVNNVVDITQHEASHVALPK